MYCRRLLEHLNGLSHTIAFVPMLLPALAFGSSTTAQAATEFKLTASDAAAIALFGISVAISEDTLYSLSASYGMTGIGQVGLTVVHWDETHDGSIFISSQVSRTELDKQFTLGLMEGDPQNIPIGPPAGLNGDGPDGAGRGARPSDRLEAPTPPAPAPAQR